MSPTVTIGEFARGEPPPPPFHREAYARAKESTEARRYGEFTQRLKIGSDIAVGLLGSRDAHSAGGCLAVCGNRSHEDHPRSFATQMLQKNPRLAWTERSDGIEPLTDVAQLTCKSTNRARSTPRFAISSLSKSIWVAARAIRRCAVSSSASAIPRFSWRWFRIALAESSGCDPSRKTMLATMVPACTPETTFTAPPMTSLSLCLASSMAACNPPTARRARWLVEPYVGGSDQRDAVPCRHHPFHLDQSLGRGRGRCFSGWVRHTPR